MLNPKIAANILLLSIFGFFVVFILWASLAELDEVTRASGRIVPSKQIQIIQNLEGGIVKEILVRQGDQVKQGDILVKLDRTQFDADFNKNEEEYFSLIAIITRLQAESELIEPDFNADFISEHENLVNRELNLFNARKAEYEATINSLTARLKQIEQEKIESEVSLISAKSASELAIAEVEILAPLVERGIEPRLELIRAEQRKVEAEGAHRIAELGIEKALKAVEETNLQIEASRQKFRASALTELNDAQINQNQLVDALPALSDRVNRTDVVAPIDGIINQVLVTTIGGVVNAGMPIVELVPFDDSLLVEAEVKPSDIAFLI